MNDLAETASRPQAKDLLLARSVAIIGASPSGPWPRTIFQNLKRGGYKGQIFLVNPKYSELWEQRCFPNLSALPEVPDHVLLLTSAAAVLPSLEEAAALGVKSGTVYSTSFGEGTGSESIERGRMLREFCERTRFVCCGPNCMGSMSVSEGFWTIPVDLAHIRPGPVGLIFQSGGSLSNWLRAAGERGIGFTYAISSGNEVSLDLVDYLSFLIDDPNTRIINLFIEGIRRPEAFIACAARALQRGKPMLAIKIGRTDASKRQARSHTGAIAGSSEVFDALCQRLGILRCPSLEDLLETTLAFVPGKHPRGGRVAIVINSGGMKGLLLDHLKEVQIELAKPNETTRQAVRSLISPELAVENPLECSVSGSGYEKTFLEIVRLHTEDDGVDLVGIHGELPRDGQKKDPADWARLAGSEKPIVAFGRGTYSLTNESRTFQEQAGIPFLQAMRPTLRALQALGFYGVRRRNPTIPMLPPAVGESNIADGDRLYEVLGNYGIIPPRQGFAETGAEAVTKAEKIGFPVALKLIKPDLLHKTDIGAVVLGIRNRRELETHARRLLPRESAPAKLLVQEMVYGTEMILGARQDPQYGPFVVIGMGGVFVEVLEDTVLRLLPVDREEAAAMIRQLKGYRVLEEFRGQPRRDLGALCRAITGLSDFFSAHRSQLNDLEINPLIVREEGCGVVAVDVKIVSNTHSQKRDSPLAYPIMGP
jgi:acyl-CoA synthetase (NDP forming)